MPDKNLAAIKMDHYNQPKFISSDVKHRATPHLIRMGVYFSSQQPIGAGAKQGRWRRRS
jgi:hypothetical protein